MPLISVLFLKDKFRSFICITELYLDEVIEIIIIIVVVVVVQVVIILEGKIIISNL